MTEWQPPMCGAKTRAGTPCKNTRVYPNGRCKNHGGLSTGPRTLEGRKRALANLKGVDVNKVRVRDSQVFLDTPRMRTHIKGFDKPWPGIPKEEPKPPETDINRWFNG